jgi:AAA domain
MSDFNIDQFLNDPSTKARLNAERERITRPKSALSTARRDEPKRTRTGNAILLKPPNGSPLPSTTLSEWDAGDDTGPILPRGWLLGNQFCRKAVSALIAPGATGKSALRMLQYLSLATGRKLTGQHVFQRGRVLLLSFEDDNEELRRRIAAACIHHQIDRSDLKGWLYCDSPKGLKLAEIAGNKARKVGPLEMALRDAVHRRKPDLVALDPFVKMHGLEENDNSAMDFVCDLLAKLAVDHNIGVDFPHHARKGALGAGESDNGRGASSIRDACRLVYTLTTMSAEEAKAFEIPEGQRKAYIRLDSAKVNIAPTAQEVAWFRLVGVRLENGTEEYPIGDEVQTVAQWFPPDTWADLSFETIDAALTAIDAGLPNGQRYSSAPNANARAAWRVVQSHCPGKSEKQCRDAIKIWVKNGVLNEQDYDDPVERKSRLGLKVDHEKRPG